MGLRYDGNKVARLSGEAFDALRALQELADLPETEFLGDKHLVASAKYHLLVAVEACIDLGNHVISRNRLRAPDDYADTFHVLGEAGVLTDDFVTRLAKMARFRNRLVHIYWEVDTPIVYRLIQEDVQDVERFINVLTTKLDEADAGTADRP